MADFPQIIQNDTASIIADVKGQMEQELGYLVADSTFERLLVSVIADACLTVTQRLNAGLSQMLVRYAQSTALDNLGENVGVKRLVATPATVKLTISTTEENISLPAGTVFGSIQGINFSTLSDLTTTVVGVYTVPAVSLQTGEQCNVLYGDIIYSDIAGVMVDNTEGATGGMDGEGDEAYRQRIMTAPQSFSVAGPRSAYAWYAKSASADIKSVSVSNPIPGTVQIVPFVSVGYDYTDLLKKVYNVCSADTVRPLSDTVVVVAPKTIPYSIYIDVTILTGYDNGVVSQAVSNAVKAYTDANSQQLGNDIILSEITRVAQAVEGVYSVSPEINADIHNIEVDAVSVGVCEVITTDITGFHDR